MDDCARWRTWSTHRFPCVGHRQSHGEFVILPAPLLLETRPGAGRICRRPERGRKPRCRGVWNKSNNIESVLAGRATLSASTFSCGIIWAHPSAGMIRTQNEPLQPHWKMKESFDSPGCLVKPKQQRKKQTNNRLQYRQTGRGLENRNGGIV